MRENGNANAMNRPIVFVSTNYLTDRILLHTNLLTRLSQSFQPVVWSPASRDEAFPKELPTSRYFEPGKDLEAAPYWLTVARHFNDFTWDHTGMSASRRSYWHHRKRHESGMNRPYLRWLARIPAAFKLQLALEQSLERQMLRYGRRAKITAWLRRNTPAALVTMYPFNPRQMEMMAAAKSVGIPIVAFVTSFDNLTTKTRLLLEYDGYIVWSENMRRELHALYPQSRNRPVIVTGAPQFDILRNESLYQTREAFLGRYGLDPARKTVVYCLGSPRFINEDYGALQLLERMAGKSEFERIQIIIRPHPQFHEHLHKVMRSIRERFPHVVIQGPKGNTSAAPCPTDEGIVEWVNTMRHADIIVNLCSSIVLDGAVFDKPVINVTFDPEPGTPNGDLVRDINYKWDHYKPITESGGTWLAKDTDEILEAIRVYSRTPELQSAQRKEMLRFICGEVDGHAAERMADAVMRIAGLLRTGDISPRESPVAGDPAAGTPTHGRGPEMMVDRSR